MVLCKVKQQLQLKLLWKRQDALIAKTRETIRGWRGKLEALVAEHEALAEDVGPAAAVSPQSPKA